MVEKYYDKNGNVGVLISRNYGAGWSTWDYDRGSEIAIDKRIIEKWLTSPSTIEMTEFLNSIGYKDVYMGGYKDLSLEFVKPGTHFYIDEYDGAESIVAVEYDKRFITA